MFNGYAAMIFGPIVVLARNWQTVQNGLISLIRAEKILNYPSEIYVPKNAVVLSKINGGIVFNKVSFYYQRNKKKILVFDKGRLIETGRHEELIKNPKSIYCQLYKIQLS